MLDPVVRAKVVRLSSLPVAYLRDTYIEGTFQEMTKSTEDLVVHISKEHLVKELGGTSTWTWEYPEVVRGENKPMSDTAGRQVSSINDSILWRRFFLLLTLLCAFVTTESTIGS